MEELRIGVVGLGVISRFHLDAFSQVDGVRLAGVCDLDETALARFRGVVPCHRDYRELLDRSRLDAVVITLPNDAHLHACLTAIDAGLGVCVEKPLALRLADGEAIVGRARAAGVVTFTAFHRRYNSSVLALLGRLPSKPSIESLTIRYWERIEDHVGREQWYLDPARCGGGCVADNGPNAFDLARLLLGELRVTGARLRRDSRGIDRQAAISLSGSSAVTAEVDLDWSYDGERKEVEVRFADGSTDVADMLAGYPAFKESLRHEYVGVLRDFRDRMARSPVTPGDAGCAVDGGLASLALVDAVYEAAAGCGKLVSRAAAGAR